MEVLNAPLKDPISMREFTSLRTRARRKIAKVPIVPASVGLKNPVIIPPITMPNTTKTTTASGITPSLSFHVDLAPGSYRRLKAYPSRYNPHEKNRYHERRYDPCKEKPAYGLLYSSP